MTPDSKETQTAPAEQPNPAPPRPRRRPHLKLRAWFFTGLVVAAPIAITIYLTVAFVNFVDAQVARLLPNALEPWTQLPFTIPGLGVLLVAAALVLLGAFTANVAGRWLIGFGERLVGRMPVVRTVYNGLKQIFETVLAQSDQSFKQVALIEFPRKGAWTLAFVTGPTRGEIQARSDEELLSVFMPTTPNPTTGFLLFLPRKDVKILDMSVEDGAKLVISGGLVAPAWREAEDAAATPVRPAAKRPETEGQPAAAAK
jgi:uncharacterized membrane protein